MGVCKEYTLRMTEVRFYEKNAPYYEFSNFYTGAPFTLDGVCWPTTEHYFQAMKFNDSVEYKNYISLCDTPLKVFAMGKQKCLGGFHARLAVNKTVCPELVNDVIRKYKHVAIRKDWDAIKEEVMKEGLMAKFKQHPRLQTLLLRTEEAVLIENSPRDSYWGIGKDGLGKNRLGVLLMEVRKALHMGI
jgi:ribA/ribD-fused uncharacterized protein